MSEHPEQVITDHPHREQQVLHAEPHDRYKRVSDAAGVEGTRLPDSPSRLEARD